MCSFDARNRGSTRPRSLRENWRLARGGEEKRASLEGAFISSERRPHGPLLSKRAHSEGCEGAGNHPSCSQSPHDKAVVARCAQSRAVLATPLKKRGRENWKGLVRRAHSDHRRHHSPSTVRSHKCCNSHGFDLKQYLEKSSLYRFLVSEGRMSLVQFLKPRLPYY